MSGKYDSALLSVTFEIRFDAFCFKQHPNNPRQVPDPASVHAHAPPSLSLLRILSDSWQPRRARLAKLELSSSQTSFPRCLFKAGILVSRPPRFPSPACCVDPESVFFFSPKVLHSNLVNHSGLGNADQIHLLPLLLPVPEILLGGRPGDRR